MSYWTRVLCASCGFVLGHCQCKKETEEMTPEKLERAKELKDEIKAAWTLLNDGSLIRSNPYLQRILKVIPDLIEQIEERKRQLEQEFEEL